MCRPGEGGKISVGSLACGESVIDQLLELNPGVGAIVLRLLHQDVDHVELRIDTEIGTAA